MSGETKATDWSQGGDRSRYEALLASIDEGFCIIQMIFDSYDHPLDYRFVEANPAFERQTGLQDAIGRTAREMIPTLEEHWFRTYGEVARTGKPIRFESGSETMGRWFDVYAFRIDDPEQGRVALLFTDTSERKRIEEERDRLYRELQLERARLEYVFKQAPAFLAVLRGSDHTFELANDAYLRLIGDRELLGRTVREAIPEVVEQGFVDLLDGVLQTGQPFLGREIPVQLVRSPGAEPEQRIVDFSYLPLLEADGAPSGIIVHGSDVTDSVFARKEVERLLQESERARADAEAARMEAEAANRAKADFLAAMSHELRTPLNAIGGYVDLLDLGVHGELTEAQRQALERVTANQRHLLTLINDVLVFAKVEAGRVEFDLQPIGACDLLSAMEPLVSPLAGLKGVALSVKKCEPDLQVFGDGERVRQVLLNLVGNAIKFAPEGGWVVLSAEQQGDWIQFHVQDNGPGIAADKIDQIFDAFVQVDRRLNKPREGVGLGLAISRDLARAMGGDLSVRSMTGTGSTFTLRLPAVTQG
ncbi:hypothetical protein BH23GEM6_BH23GEM6_24860 [soil metagenome]